MFITKEHYNALLEYKDIALKTIQNAKDVIATNKEVCDFNKQLIEELRKIPTEVAMEIFADIEQNSKLLFDGVQNIVVMTETDFEKIKKKYTEDKT